MYLFEILNYELLQLKSVIKSFSATMNAYELSIVNQNFLWNLFFKTTNLVVKNNLSFVIEIR